MSMSRWQVLLCVAAVAVVLAFVDAHPTKYPHVQLARAKMGNGHGMKPTTNHKQELPTDGDGDDDGDGDGDGE
jgi:hypothetical protein